MKKKSDIRSRGHGAAENAPPPAGPAADPQASLTAILAELDAKKDAYHQLAADFDNFKKRTRRDTEQLSAAQKEAFITDLLPVLDNLERALAAGPGVSAAQLHQGVTMTLHHLRQLLNRHGIEAVEDVGRPFDVHRHEAVAVRNDPGQPDHSILEVTQRGYCCGSRVFRPAVVVVNDWSISPGAPLG